MATQQDSETLLNQLQTQVNLVLESTGRLLAATHANPKSIPITQAIQFRHLLPSATARFHNALDQLENELHLAKAVMRRDLAVCLEKTGVHQTQSQMDVDLAQSGEPIPDVQPKAPSAPTSPRTVSSEVKDSTASKDVTMEDGPSESIREIEDSVKDDSTADALAASENITEFNNMEPEADDAPATSNGGVEEKIDQTETSENVKEPDPNSAVTDNQDPDDNALMNTDLDSLFNDTFSDGAGDNNGLDQNLSAEFDFDSFSANLDSNPTDNDISALLPGLQDYANPQSKSVEDIDLSALLSQVGDAQGDELGEPGSLQHRDSTFDDLMDLPKFDGDIGGADETQNEDIDLDSLFT